MPTTKTVSHRTIARVFKVLDEWGIASNANLSPAVRKEVGEELDTFYRTLTAASLLRLFVTVHHYSKIADVEDREILSRLADDLTDVIR